MIRKAHMKDAQAIQSLVNSYATQGLMLALSLSDLYDRLRDYIVFEANGVAVGTGALHFTWDGLAELRSLAVSPEHLGQGIARRLCTELIEEARVFDCKRVFTLTYIPDFFTKLGFREIPKDELPHKVWADCVKCPKFPDCGETPLAIDL